MATARKQRIVCIAVLSTIAMTVGTVLAGEPATSQPPAATQPTANFDADLQSFTGIAATLPPDQAATQWLTLYDRLTHSAKPNNGYISFGGDEPDADLFNLVAALPPPAAWPSLAAQADARPLPPADDAFAVSDASLRVFAALLRNDSTRVKTALDRLDSCTRQPHRRADLPPGMGREWFQQAVKQPLEKLHEAIGAQATKPTADEVIANLERQVAAANPDSSYERLDLPDLVSIAGPERAEAFLRKALVAPIQLDLSSSVGQQTTDLVRRLVRELAPNMLRPCWPVAEGLDGVETFEALDARFGRAAFMQNQRPTRGRNGGMSGTLRDLMTGRRGAAAAPNVIRGYDPTTDWQRGYVTGHYVVALLARGRADDARAFMERELSRANEAEGNSNMGRLDIAANADETLTASGKAGVAMDALEHILKAAPRLPLWDLYQKLALRSGNAARLIATAQGTMNSSALDPAHKLSIRDALRCAWLATDFVEEAMTAALEDMSAARESNDAAAMQRLAASLAEIGTLTQDNDWRDVGLETLVGQLSRSGKLDYSTRSDLVRAASLLERAGRRSVAIELLSGALDRHLHAVEQERAASASHPDQPEGDWSSPIDDGEQAKDLLIELLALHYRAGDYAKVIALLDENPNWGKRDVAELVRDSADDGARVGYMIADSLAHVGRRDNAKRVIDATLDVEGGYDPAYALRVDLSENAAEANARLDQLFARDHYEERPLIWKAELARRAGQLDDAERLARQAIAIDPSDGEQGPGRRMYVYSVLAETLAAKGDAAQAQLYRGVIAAIREAEQADQFYRAGLLQRAAAMYTDSLNKFADAYCIQSRLAVQLSEAGRTDEAEAHYRKAYELMPDSFGEVESHCFGCEGAFRGPKAQAIAESVFTKLASEHPKDHPQVHYLLGYLREQQGRYADALDAFRVAVRLDPNYLNAWKHLLDAAKNLPDVPQAEFDTAALALFRLDPLDRHDGHGSAVRVHDLQGLWTAADQALPLYPTPPTSLLPLTASARQLDDAVRAQAQKDREHRVPFTFDGHSNYRHPFFGMRTDGQPLRPGEAVARTDLIRALTLLMAIDRPSEPMRRRGF